MENNQLIAATIYLLEQGRYRDRKEYISQLAEHNSVDIDKYTYQRDDFCWIVWKPTDIETQPQFKGESLMKIVPRMYLNKEQIVKILEAEPWSYV